MWRHKKSLKRSGTHSFAYFSTKHLPSMGGTKLHPKPQGTVSANKQKIFYGIFYARRGILSITVWPFTGNFRTNSRFFISDFFCKFRAIPREATRSGSWKTRFYTTPCILREADVRCGILCLAATEHLLWHQSRKKLRDGPFRVQKQSITQWHRKRNDR